MRFDVMLGPSTWQQTAEYARAFAEAGVSGLVFTETSQTPWMALTAAALAAPELELSTGIAVAFPRSPMVTAALAWELADNTGGRFRLGLGTQVKAHVERRYGVEFDPPAARMRGYVEAVRACFRAFRRQGPLRHDGRFHNLSLLPPDWAPRRHEHEDVKIDISAVGPVMCRLAGELADGIHVHPLHSTHYLRTRLEPALEQGLATSGCTRRDVQLIVPVFAVPGDSDAERAPLLARARRQIAFYGATRNYAFQFDDLGFEGTSARLNAHLKAGRLDELDATITDEMLAQFAVVAPWDEMADRLTERYANLADRVAMYLAEASVHADPSAVARWGEVARAVTQHHRT